MRRRAAALALPLAALLTACVALPVDDRVLDGETLSGRLALRIDTVEFTSRDDQGQRLSLGLTVSGLRLTPLEAKP